MTKTERGDIGISKFRTARGIGAFDYVMRFGKTELGLRVAKLVRNAHGKGKIIVIVPSIVVKDVWLITIIEKFVGLDIEVLTADYILNNVESVEDKDCLLLIVDEIHKFTSEERLKIVDSTILDSKFRLALTGTYPYGNKIIEDRFPVIDVITEKEAIKEEWISKFIEYNIKLEMNMDDKLKYLKYSSIIRDTLKSFKDTYKLLKFADGTNIFDNDLQVILSCYTGKDLRHKGHDFIKPTHIREVIAQKMGWQYELDLTIQYNEQLDAYWKPENIYTRAVEFHRVMQKRNTIHNDNIVKLNAVMLIYDYYKDKCIISFNQSIDFADKITEFINNEYKKDKAISYHSQSKGKSLINFITNKPFLKKDGEVKRFGVKKQLSYIIEMMRIGKYNMLNTVSALDEGLNIPNIDLVITTSGTANPLKYAQQSARGKTVDIYNSNKRTIILNLFFDDFIQVVDGESKFFKSRDKTKLLIRQNNPLIPIVSITEIIKNN